MGVLFNLYFNKKIIDSAKEHFSVATHNEYNLSIDELTINLFTQSITLRNFIITPSKNETSLKTQYAFKTKKLRIVNFSIMSYINKKNLLKLLFSSILKQLKKM